ncbi:hypothetical protein BpHYR1_051123 [Brachionus plicatilis]|uniref:Uncharacterized protein n=1 Tax=Brachionus plicatilis TaxID=10195 RepID=A0A3M7PGX5_BRAPC|nr:hypothetical protein BpHYR1_051123 [Brachionus plicatilis]
MNARHRSSIRNEKLETGSMFILGNSVSGFVTLVVFDNIDRLMHIDIMTIITSNGLYTLVPLNNLNTSLRIF